MYGWCKQRDIEGSGKTVSIVWLPKTFGKSGVDPVSRQYAMESVVAAAMADLVRRYQDAKGSLLDAEMRRTFEQSEKAAKLSRWQMMFSTRSALAEARNRTEHPGPSETLVPGALSSSRYLLFKQIPLEQADTSAGDVIRRQPQPRGALARKCFKIESYRTPVTSAAEKANIMSSDQYLRYQLKRMFGSSQAQALWGAVFSIDSIKLILLGVDINLTVNLMCVTI